MNLPFSFLDSNSIEWKELDSVNGVEVKRLHAENGQIMEVYRFAANASYPDHQHAGVEYVYMLEGSARFNGQWIYAGWSSVAPAGSKDIDFVSGEEGCVYLTVYSVGSKFV